MSIKEQQTDKKYNESFLLFKMMYSQLVDILNAVGYGKMIFKDDSLNECYIHFKKGYDNFLENEMNDLKDRAPQLLDMITGNEQDINYTWEQWHLEFDKFYGELEKIRIDRKLEDIKPSGPLLKYIIKPIKQIIKDHNQLDKDSFEKMLNPKSKENIELPKIIYNEISGKGKINNHDLNLKIISRSIDFLKLFIKI